MSDYMIARTSWLADMECLSDSERGRLFVALLKFAATGTMEEPRGTERVLFYKMCKECANDVQMRNIYIDPNNTLSQVSNSPSNNTNTILDFNTFWSAYPTKVNKKRCVAIWNNIKPSAELVDRMIESIEAWKKSRQWQQGYVPNPDTWLRNEKWNDADPEPWKDPKQRHHYANERDPISETDFNALVVDLGSIDL